METKVRGALANRLARHQPSARGGSAATRAISNCFRRRSAGRPNQLTCLGSNAYTAIELLSHYGEKRAGDPGVECKARRQLHQQAAEARAQRREVCQERLERRCAIGEPLVMRDGARELDGEPERARYARGPTLKRRGAMWAIESGIDFDSGKHLRITREVRLAPGKASCAARGILHPAVPIYVFSNAGRFMTEACIAATSDAVKQSSAAITV